VPFGFEVQLIDGRKKLVKNANEQAVIQLASKLRKKGHSPIKLYPFSNKKAFNLVVKNGTPSQLRGFFIRVLMMPQDYLNQYDNTN
jgi:hypothetical protein